MPGFTRQIILQTLTELMNEKPLSKITVKDIVERCGVNRNTFYYHFQDIPDAVEAMVREELDEILTSQQAPESVSECMEILVNAVQKNKKPWFICTVRSREMCLQIIWTTLPNMWWRN